MVAEGGRQKAEGERQAVSGRHEQTGAKTQVQLAATNRANATHLPLLHEHTNYMANEQEFKKKKQKNIRNQNGLKKKWEVANLNSASHRDRVTFCEPKIEVLFKSPRFPTKSVLNLILRTK